MKGIRASKVDFTAWPLSLELAGLLISFGRMNAMEKVIPRGCECYLG